MLLEGHVRKQPSTGVFVKGCSENMQEMYRRTRMAKPLCSFIEILFQHGYFHVNLKHIFRIPFPKITFGGLLLYGRISSWAY